jgi:hypothetical protein
MKMENVGLSVDFHWTLWKSSRPLIYLMFAGFKRVCRKYLYATPWSFLQWCEHYLQCSANGGKNHGLGDKLNAVEVKLTSHLLDVCRFRLFLWQFDGFLRIFRFPSSLIQPVLYIVHVHRNNVHITPWSFLQWCEHYLQCSANGGKNHGLGDKFSPKN